MRILLINNASTGHHLEYKRLLDKAFSELGHEVLHYDQSEKTIQCGSLFPACAGKDKYSTPPLDSSQLVATRRLIRQKALNNWNRLVIHLRHLEKESNRPDLLFFAHLDAYIRQYLTKWDIEYRLKNIPFSGILFQPIDTRQMPLSFLRRGPFDPYHVLKSRLCRSVCVLMEESISFMADITCKSIIALPDIISIPESVQDSSLGKMIRDRAGRRFVIGIWGSLQQRKGTSDFLQMALKLPREAYFLVMAGQCHRLKGWPERDKFLYQQGTSDAIENLCIIDRWLSDDELLSGLPACDLIFAAYPNWKFTSGFIGKAAAVQVPILVNDGFVMAQRVRKFNLGFVKQESSDVSTWVLDNIEAVRKLRISAVFNNGCEAYCDRFGFRQWRESLARLIEFYG